MSQIEDPEVSPETPEDDEERSSTTAGSRSRSRGTRATNGTTGTNGTAGSAADDATWADGSAVDDVPGSTAGDDDRDDVDGADLRDERLEPDETADVVMADLDVDLDDEDYSEFWGEDPVDDDVPAAPVKKKSRHQKRKEWRQTERARRYAARRSVRFPIFTRSILLWMLLFAMMGAAFGGSGAFFWAHFNTEITELREQTTDFDKRSQEARAEIDAMRNQAVTDINNQLKPIAPFLAEANTIKQAETVSPYVWFVATENENGDPAVGSAFSVATDDAVTLMITSYDTVKAGTVNPAPKLAVRKGQEEIPGRVVSFDANKDLALIEVQRANMPVLEWASDADQAAALGLRVFPVSGLGGTGAALTSGIIIDQSGVGMLHTAPIGDFMQGGPIITADYKVIGVASIAYKPLGFDPGEIHFSVPINSVCEVLMECGGGARTRKP